MVKTRKDKINLIRLLTEKQRRKDINIMYDSDCDVWVVQKLDTEVKDGTYWKDIKAFGNKDLAAEFSKTI